VTVKPPFDHRPSQHPLATAARTHRVAITLFLALASTGTLAATVALAATMAPVEGGTNLPAPGYPDHKCSAPPYKPEKPFRNDEYSTRSYTAEVERYNRQLKDYRDCMADYVDNANNDIKRIQGAAQKALDEFRSL
jgi:hypothetical protein